MYRFVGTDGEDESAREHPDAQMQLLAALDVHLNCLAGAQRMCSPGLSRSAPLLGGSSFTTAP